MCPIRRAVAVLFVFPRAARPSDFCVPFRRVDRLLGGFRRLEGDDAVGVGQDGFGSCESFCVPYLHHCASVGSSRSVLATTVNLTPLRMFHAFSSRES